MSVTITLPPATEARLRAEAAATGKDVAAVVVEAVEARLTLAQLGLRDILGLVHEDFRKSGMTEVELDTLLREALAESRGSRKAGPGSAA